MPDASILQALPSGLLIIIIYFQYTLHSQFRDLGERISRLEGKLENCNHCLK